MNNHLPTPTAVIFDWDNTLVNTWPIIHQALHDTFVEMGRAPWSLEHVQHNVRKSLRDSFPEIFGNDWQRAGEIYQKHYQANHLIKLTPLPQAEDVLEAVGKRGLKRLLVSNKKGVNLRKEVIHLKWERHFDCVVGADDAARDKPHPDPVHLVLEGTDIVPGPHIWFLGDSEVDLACAAATGCTPILYGDIATGHPAFTPSHLMGFPYLHHVRDHAAMLALLDSRIKRN